MKTFFKIKDAILTFIYSLLVFIIPSPLNMVAWAFNILLTSALFIILTNYLLSKFKGYEFEVAFFILGSFWGFEFFSALVTFQGFLDNLMMPVFYTWNIILVIAAHKIKKKWIILLIGIISWIYFIFWGLPQWLEFRGKDLSLYDLYINNLN